MLVLTRRLGERIAIGDDVRVEILSVRNGQVRVGVAAPRDVPITRVGRASGAPRRLREPPR